MIAEGANIAEEYYFSLLLDRANRSYLAMCSKEGGMEIEQLAVERPEALARVPVDPNVGIDQAKADEIVAAAGFDGDDAAEIARVLQLLGKVYEAEDATLVEVNPLVKTADGQDRRPRRQGVAGRERRVPPRRPRRRWPTSPRRTRWRRRPRRRASTTSSSTAASASSATARAW